MKRVLIANRGEIAERIGRTCAELGIETVAVHSQADRDAPFVRAATMAVELGPAPAAESYLSIERVIDAAARSGADAVHPGYGFLAENADFAAACAQAGLTFIGPTANTIRTLGSKVEARRIAAEAGVPVVPSFELDAIDEAALPVLLKASAGGGGKGMTIVRDLAQLDGAIESARRIARQAFGDDTLIAERYLERPRHIEIQIIADHHGNAIHLGERECSVQRRHQKIIEEAPAPSLPPQLPHKLAAAALEIAAATQYRNAGTVEFIVSGDEFYFLEVNTRLQVEHPVTELCYGIDLVAEQIRVARGEPLSRRQDDVVPNGHAIECRLYAEDADAGFLPATGQLLCWRAPSGVRVDAGVESGSQVTVHYDPMLAKVIAHEDDRTSAIRALDRALCDLVALGVTTNREYLRRVLALPRFESGDTDTHMLTDCADELSAAAHESDDMRDAAIAATVARAVRSRRQSAVLPALRPGFRVSRGDQRRTELVAQPSEQVVELAYRFTDRDQAVFTFGEQQVAARCARHGDASITVQIDGIAQRYALAFDGDATLVQSATGAAFQFEPRTSSATSSGERAAGDCRAPMPGKVVEVVVAAGDAVEAGQTLLVLEAMKMEHAVTAPQAGTIKELLVSAGTQVAARDLLAVVDATD